MTYTWQTLKQNIIQGKTNLDFQRKDEIQRKYHEAREYVQSLKFREYSDFIKIKHLAYNSNVNKDGVVVSRKVKNSLSYMFVENEYPYCFEEPSIKHYLIWSLKPLDYLEICTIVTINNLQHMDWTWFVNTTAKKSVKDLWHCHIFLKME
jgi:Protein of unknown function (DUF3605)